MPYNPANLATSPLDQVRFLIGDTGPSFILTDDEINYLIATTTSVGAAASAAASRIAVRFGAKSDKTVGDLSISYQDRADQFQDLANSLSNVNQAPAPFAGGITDELAVPLDRDRMFEIGMHDALENKIRKLSDGGDAA